MLFNKCLNSEEQRLRLAKKPKPDVKWEAAHKEMYSKNGFEWPPVAESLADFLYLGLPRREAEIIYFFELTMPPSSRCSLDVSQSWPSRLPIGYDEEVPCVTGSTNLVNLRKDGDGTFSVRRVLPVELLALQGFASLTLF